MEWLDTFLQEIYEPAPHNRILVKTIYEDFGAWVIAKHGPAVWNICHKCKFYRAISANVRYVYERSYDGVCLRGLKYRGTDLLSPGQLYRQRGIIQSGSGRVKPMRLAVIKPGSDSPVVSQSYSGSISPTSIGDSIAPNPASTGEPTGPSDNTAPIYIGETSIPSAHPTPSSATIGETSIPSAHPTPSPAPSSTPVRETKAPSTAETSAMRQSPIHFEITPVETPKPMIDTPPRPSSFVPRKVDRRHRPASPKPAPNPGNIYVAGRSEIPDLDRFCKPYLFNPDGTRKDAVPTPAASEIKIPDQIEGPNQISLSSESASRKRGPKSKIPVVGKPKN